MKKRILSVVLVLGMLVGTLAGCGSSEESESASTELTLWMAPMASSDGDITDEEYWTEKTAAFAE